MPPELLSDGKLTKAADVYAFGKCAATIKQSTTLTHQSNI